MKAELAEAGGDDPHKLIVWKCPGCNESHGVPVKPRRNAAWEWNGSLEAPTLSPSVLVTSGHYSPTHRGDCWCSFKRASGEPSVFKCYRCHCFIRDGKIEFLGDCTHALAGSVVPMPDVE